MLYLENSIRDPGIENTASPLRGLGFVYMYFIDTINMSDGRTTLDVRVLKTVRSPVYALGDDIFLLSVGYVYYNGFKDLPLEAYFVLAYCYGFDNPFLIDVVKLEVETGDV